MAPDNLTKTSSDPHVLSLVLITSNTGGGVAAFSGLAVVFLASLKDIKTITRLLPQSY